MSIKSVFNKIAEKRATAKAHKALMRAIRARDLEAVQKMLADDPDIVGYNAGVNTHRKKPLWQALETGDAEIFEAILKTQEGGMTSALWFADFRKFDAPPSDTDGQVYFLPSYLYVAIEQGKEDIALILVRAPVTDVNKSGDLLRAGGAGHLPREHAFYKLLTAPLDLAREKGMDAVVKMIEMRAEGLQGPRTPQDEAAALMAAARDKRAQAETLLKEADELETRGNALLRPDEQETDHEAAPAPKNDKPAASRRGGFPGFKL